VIANLSAALRRTSDASSVSMPWTVMDVELRGKLRWPWMHLRRLKKSLIEALLLRVAVNLANFPKNLLSNLSR
jgi:hypothetical protein